MITRDPKRKASLFLIGAIFLLVATACVPEVTGVFVGMDEPGTTADGLDYDANDIIFIENPEYISDVPAWMTLFDGEWYGLSDEDHDLSAFSFNEAILPFGIFGSAGPNDAEEELELYLSFEQNRARVPGIPGHVLGQDIVKFNATSPGAFSADDATYSYEVFFDGSDVGLTKASEKVDGISVWPPEYFQFNTSDVEFPYDCNAGVIFLSTRGSHRVSPTPDGGHLVGDGSDVLAFCAFNTGPDTAGFWFRVFDGSEAQIKPRNALTGLDVWSVDLSMPLTNADAGTLDIDVSFFFTPRKPFTAHGGSVSGDLSDLFFGRTSDGSTYIEHTGFNLNDGNTFPPVNGVVENASVLDFLNAAP
jgi:hypothetical protein